MFALNFQSEHHEQMLISRKKNCTVRLGDVSSAYPENSIVWITFGKKHTPRRKLYTAIIDKVSVKHFHQLTAEDLAHQNPDIKSAEELIRFFEHLYGKAITLNDKVSVIYFSEILEP
jgi:hypothetical protein